MNEIIGVTGGAAFAAAFLINEALKQTPAVNNKWLPLIGVTIGFIVGLGFGLADDQSNIGLNILMGMAAGGNSTTINEIFKHFMGGK